jgi:hypothetical protein
MAVRFDAAADRLLLTTSLFDYNANYTVMGWFYLTSDLNANTTFVSINNTTSNIDQMRTTSTGTLLQLSVTVGGTNTTGNGSDLSISTWYHLAMVRESVTSLRLYLNGVSNATNARSVTGRTAAARFELGASLAANGERLDGRCYALKAWSSDLTASEVLQEMNTIRPRRTANLYGWWPTLPGSGERARDYSGNGHDFTESGTLTDEDPPPVSWGSSSLFVNAPSIVVAGRVLSPRSMDGLGVYYRGMDS